LLLLNVFLFKYLNLFNYFHLHNDKCIYEFNWHFYLTKHFFEKNYLTKLASLFIVNLYKIIKSKVYKKKLNKKN